MEFRNDEHTVMYITMILMNTYEGSTEFRRFLGEHYVFVPAAKYYDSGGKVWEFFDENPARLAHFCSLRSVEKRLCSVLTLLGIRLPHTPQNYQILSSITLF